MYSLSDLPGSVRAQINAAGFPTKSVGWEFSDLDQNPVVDEIYKWIKLVEEGRVITAAGDKKCGLGLLLQGEPGHGKTTLASITAQTLIRTMAPIGWGTAGSAAKRPVVFLDYPKLLRLQKQQWSEFDDSLEVLINGLYGEAGRDNNVRLLVLDDLGKEYRTASGWAENTFDALLRARFNAGLPTIVTTNYSLDKWDSMYGESMGSFGHEAFVPLDIIATGGDRRR
jgi:DNA replication protein DnaC